METSGDQPPAAPGGPGASDGASFLDILSSAERHSKAIGATVAAFFAVVNQFTDALGRNRYPSYAAVVVMAALLVLYLRSRWRRNQIQPVQTTLFAGPQPLSEQDAGRFFGRDAEIRRILDKLADPETTHLVVLGETGCGKSSLLLAGVLPQLNRDGHAHCLYVCLKDQPVRRLRDTLRKIGAPSASDPHSPPTLIEEYDNARVRAEKPLVLVIDQFEELYVNPASPAEFQAVRELIWHLLGVGRHTDAKVIFSLRHDFLHQFDAFYDRERVDARFASLEVQVRIEPFDKVVAAQVLRQMVTRQGQLQWDPQLLNRVIDDLTVTRAGIGQSTEMVLPSELQIVCQMIQTRGVTTVRQYPGKKTLLLRHIEDAIGGTVNGNWESRLARQLLLSLVDPNGLTKARPQTLDELAQTLHLRQQDRSKLEAMLGYFDKQRRIVRCLSQQRDEGPPLVVYELAHDYVAGLIQAIAGQEMTGVRRSQAIIDSARRHREYDSRYRMGIGDCLQLYRHPPDRLTSDDRVLLRQSMRTFLLRWLIPAFALILCWAVVRFGTVHLAMDHGTSYVMARRGLPWVPPLLGSERAAIYMDIQSDSALSLHDAGKEMLRRIEEKRVRPALLPSRFSYLSAEGELRDTLTRMVRSYLQARTHDVDAVEDYADYDLARFALALGLETECAERFEWMLRTSLERHRGQCQGEADEGVQCQAARTALVSLAARLYDLRPGNPGLVKEIRKLLLENEPGTWNSVVAFAVLHYLRGLDEETRQKLSDKVNRAGAAEIGRLVWTLKGYSTMEHPLPRLLGADISEKARAVLGDAIAAPSTTLAEQRQRSRWLDTIVALGLPNQRALDYLYQQLSGADFDEVVRAQATLLRMGVNEDRLVDWLVTNFTEGRAALADVVNISTEREQILNSDKYPKPLRLSLAVLGPLSTSKLLARQPPLLRQAFEAFLRESLRRGGAQGIESDRSDARRLIYIGRRIGIPLSTLIELFPKQGTLAIGEFSRFRELLLGTSMSWLPEEERANLRRDRSAAAVVSLWISQGIEQRGYEACTLASFALDYHISQPAIDLAIEKKLMDPRCTYRLTFPYARTRLLSQVEGSTDQDDAGRPSQRLEETLAALLPSLKDASDDRLARSLPYRRAKAEAVGLLVKRLRSLRGSAKAEPVLAEHVKQVQGWLTQPDTPFYLRLELADVLLMLRPPR